MKININNRGKVDIALANAQKRASARTLAYDDVINIINSIEVPKSRLDGTHLHYDGAEKFPNSYRYIPYSTHFKAENVKGRWYITDIYRDRCPNRIASQGNIEFSESAKDWILKNASKLA